MSIKTSNQWPYQGSLIGGKHLGRDGASLVRRPLINARHDQSKTLSQCCSGVAGGWKLTMLDLDHPAATALHFGGDNKHFQYREGQ